MGGAASDRVGYQPDVAGEVVYRPLNGSDCHSLWSYVEFAHLPNSCVEVLSLVP